MLAGKYRPGLRGCNIGDGGSEVSLARLWGTDGRCRQPLQDQTPDVVATLGHDGWELCID